MKASTFRVPAMDCPSEEQLVRSALADAVGIAHFGFDLSGRSVTIRHEGDVDAIVRRLEGLDLGAELVRTEELAPDDSVDEEADQSRVLWFALVINVAMFAVELVAGLFADSTGLLADSLDMLADAGVYGLSLWAVGTRASRQRAAARLSGWLQLLLAVGLFAEVARRAVMGSEPQSVIMLGIAGLALVANVVCMMALARHRRGGVHMQASWIFTSNDVIANIGVIVAGGLVAWTASPIPDLVIGMFIGLVVLRGAVRILRLGARSDA